MMRLFALIGAIATSFVLVSCGNNGFNLPLLDPENPSQKSNLNESPVYSIAQTERRPPTANCRTCGATASSTQIFTIRLAGRAPYDIEGNFTIQVSGIEGPKVDGILGITFPDGGRLISTRFNTLTCDQPELLLGDISASGMGIFYAPSGVTVPIRFSFTLASEDTSISTAQIIITPAKSKSILESITLDARGQIIESMTSGAACPD